jgi:uncharacterized protein (TIGR00369 family)
MSQEQLINGLARTVDAIEILREPPVGGWVDGTLLPNSWRDLPQLLQRGDAPQPPIAHLSGRRLIDVKEGQATVAMPASDWLCGPKGRLDAGMFAFLADMAHFYAVLSTLPAGARCTTAELSMTFLGQPPCAGGELQAHSEVVYTDERNALATGVVYDNDCRPVAHSTSRCFLFAPGTATQVRAGRDPEAGATSQAPDPILRPCPPMTSLLDEDTLDRVSGLEILREELAGAREPPPIDRLTGIRLTHACDGHVIFSLPAHGWLLQEIGTVFGGMIALLAKAATAGAVQAAADAGTRFTALDLKVNFLRPVQADGTELVATGKVLHRGRNLSIADTEVTHGGRTVAIATGTTALTRPHAPTREEHVQ